MSERITEETIRGVEGVLLGESATARAAHQSLKGDRRGIRKLWPFLGPAFVAAVAYVDPGNFATNISAGAQFGYLLLWVILCSNLMAMLIQSMSAKLGIATGKNLPEVCRDRFPKPVTLLLWVQAEVIAMATDLAEFIGAALALNLLFGIPLFPAGLLTAGGDLPLRAHRRGDRHGHRRDHQRQHAHHGGGPLQRQRPDRRRRYRPGLRAARGPGQRQCGDHLRRGPARERLLELLGGHDGWPGRDAGLHKPPNPAIPAPPDHDGP